MKKEEIELLAKAKAIISNEQKINNSEDQSYIQGIKFIFTKEFTQTNIFLPVEKKNKESFNYLNSFVTILDILFKKTEEERNKLYMSKVSPVALGNELYNLILNMKKYESKINNSDLLGIDIRAYLLFRNYLKMMDNVLQGSLNLYFYYLGFIISLNTFQFLLYYLLKIDKVFYTLNYKDFCPDLKSQNCINLIILFFKNIARDPKEILSIYALLIFKYKYVFKDIQDGIEESILEKSAKETLNIVNGKTLDNLIILQYIFNDFIHNLKKNIDFSLDETKSQNKGKNENKNKENKKLISFVHDNIEKNNIDKSNIMEISNEEKNRVNNKVEENIKSSNQSPKNNINEIKDYSQSEISTSAENNNGHNGIKGNNLSNLTINVQNNNSDLNKKFNNDKNEIDNNINKEYEEYISSTNKNEQDKSKEIQNLYEVINKLKKENEERFEKLEKNNNDLQNEIQQMKKTNQSIINILGKIQMRDRAKNVLSPYEYLLTEEDKKSIKEYGKWITIADKIKKKYKDYKKNKKYTVFIEFVNKCANLIEKGNEDAHRVYSNYYEKDITNFIQNNNLKGANLDKICFLILINISKESLMDVYNLVDIYYENDMKRAIIRGKPLEEYFKD